LNLKACPLSTGTQAGRAQPAASTGPGPGRRAGRGWRDADPAGRCGRGRGRSPPPDPGLESSVTRRRQPGWQPGPAKAQARGDPGPRTRSLTVPHAVSQRPSRLSQLDRLGTCPSRRRARPGPGSAAAEATGAPGRRPWQPRRRPGPGPRHWQPLPPPARAADPVAHPEANDFFKSSFAAALERPPGRLGVGISRPRRVSSHGCHPSHHDSDDFQVLTSQWRRWSILIRNLKSCPSR
jgi:hypothetical protein